MSKFKPGDDILDVWKDTITNISHFGFKVGDVVQVKSEMRLPRKSMQQANVEYALVPETYFIEQRSCTLYLVPMYDLKKEPRQVTITQLQDQGFKVIGNIKKNPMLKILYGRE